MVRPLEHPLEAGGSVRIQVEDGHGWDAEVTRGWGDRDLRVVEQGRESFEQTVARVQPAVQGLVQQLRSLADSPDATSGKFGLELNAEVDAFVTGASTEGAFKVSMTWPPRRQPEAA